MFRRTGRRPRSARGNPSGGCRARGGDVELGADGRPRDREIVEAGAAEIVADSDRREREVERPARVSPQGGATAPPAPDPAALRPDGWELPSRRSGSPRSAEAERSSTAVEEGRNPGGGRRVRHDAPATAHLLTTLPPHRCRLRGRPGRAAGLAEVVVGRLVEPGVERARPSAVSDGQARPRGRGPAAFLTVPRARASRDDLQAEGWTDSALHPVAAPAVAEGRRTGSGHRRSRRPR